MVKALTKNINNFNVLSIDDLDVNISDEVVLRYIYNSFNDNKTYILEYLLSTLDESSLKEILFRLKDKNNYYVIDHDDFIIKYIDYIIDENGVEYKTIEYYKNNNKTRIIDFTEKSKKYNKRLMYHRDIKDLMKDIYKNVNKKN